VGCTPCRLGPGGLLSWPRRCMLVAVPVRVTVLRCKVIAGCARIHVAVRLLPDFTVMVTVDTLLARVFCRRQLEGIAADCQACDGRREREGTVVGSTDGCSWSRWS